MLRDCANRSIAVLRSDRTQQANAVGRTHSGQPEERQAAAIEFAFERRGTDLIDYVPGDPVEHQQSG